MQAGENPKEKRIRQRIAGQGLKARRILLTSSARLKPRPGYKALGLNSSAAPEDATLEAHFQSLSGAIKKKTWIFTTARRGDDSADGGGYARCG